MPHWSARADQPASRLVVGVAFAAIYLFWGGTFLALRYAVVEVPPLLTIAIRCVGGAGVLYGWLLWRGELEPTTTRQWLTSALAGGFLFVGCHGVLAWAEQRVTSGQAALYLTSTSLWMVLLSAVRERRFPTGKLVLGLLLGVIGIAVLVGGKSEAEGSLTDRVILVGTGLSWAVGSLIARDGARPRSAIQSTAMQLGAGGAVVLSLSLATGELRGWDTAQVSGRGAGALVFLVLAGTVLGFGAYTWLMQVASPALVGTYSFVNPVVALALAWALGDERFSWQTVGPAVIVLGAVILIWSSAGTPQLRQSSNSAPPPWPDRLRALARARALL
jgi:drug/metabolite transporter (DMT)-like permease